MSNMCLVVTSSIRKLADKIRQEYPEASNRNGFSDQMCAEWIGLYNNTNSKNPDNVPAMKSLVNFIEKLRNKEGKSFLRDLKAEERQRAIEQEMQGIKAKAIANGTFMKAPNGKPTNLTERQWLQVRTKNFINWFGDWINDPANASKVVDENGEPLVVYHYSNNETLTEFSTDFDNYFSQSGGTKKAIFFTEDNPNEEERGSNFLTKRRNKIAVFLNIKDLKTYKGTKEDLHNQGTSYREVVNKSAEENDVDGGVHMEDFNDNKKEHQSIWITHNPNQIKSATDNNGEFSTENNSILASPAQYEEIPVELMTEMADEEASITAFDSRESSDPDLNKKFGGKTEVSVSEMLNNLLANNTPFEGFIKALQENIGELGDIKIQLVPNSNSKIYGIAGLYSSLDNTIYINRNANYKGKDGKVDNTIIHEIVHAIVANSLNTPKHREELGKLFDEAREKILKKYDVDTFEELPENLRKGRLYGLQNLDEFAAEFFTNSEFILELNDENTFGKRSDKKSLFNRLVEWIKSLLPKGVTETYKRSGEILEDILLNSGGSIQNNRNLLAGSNSAANTQSTKLSTPESPLQVYSDGSDFKGTGKIGYGSVFEFSGRQYGISGTEENDEVKNLQKQFPDAKFSNPTMEMLALATTLEHFASMGNGENIVINQDYKGACNYQGLWEYSEGSTQRDPKAWKAKEPYIKHLVDRSVAAIEKIKQDGGSVKINWVKGHQTAGTEQARMNDVADKYAKSRDNSNNINDAYMRQRSQPASTIVSRFKQGIETLTGYYEGGGRLITDDFPGVPKELDDKLNNHFMGGEELSDDDYRELAKYISVVKNTDANTSQSWPYIAVPKQQTQQQQIKDINTISDKSAAYGVEIDSGLKYHYTEWQQSNPNGIIAYRINYYTYNTPQEALAGRIGNPFSEGSNRGPQTVQQFYDWIVTGNNFGNRKATKAYREAIIQKILSTPEGSPVLYYTELNRPSHATVIGYLVNNKQLLQQPVQQQTAQSSPSPSQADLTKGKGNNDLAASAVGFEYTPEELEEMADAAVRREAAANRPKATIQESGAYEIALKPNESRMAQFSRTFSPQQIKDRGAMIADIFSDILDDAVQDEIDAQLDVVENEAASEEEKTQARQRINALSDPVRGRQLAAQEKGIPAIMSEIKERIQDYMESADDSKKILYQNTLDYFNDLFNTQATLDIEEREGIRIINLDVAEQTADEDDTDSQDDGDDDVGHIASGSDGWSYRARFEDPFSTLSKKVKSMLYDINRPEGEVDDLGMQKKYPMGQIYASLLSYLSKHMENADDFLQVDRSFEGKDNWGNDITEESYPNGYPTFPVLEEMKGMYPWVEQIIQRLTDDYLNPEWNSSLRYPSTGGAMASQFYVNFRKPYIPYGKVQLGDNNFGITPLNFQMEDKVQKDKLEANYNNRMVLTEHSVYNPDGKVNRENAEWLGKKISEVIFDLEHHDFVNFPELLEYHNQNPEEETVTQQDIDEYDQFLGDVRHILQSFGIDATQDGVAAYLTIDEGKVIKDMLSGLTYIADRIAKIPDDNIDTFNYMVDLRNPYGENVWAHFFDGKGMISDESYMQSFYDSASHKTKYSYSADNYLMKTFRGVSMGSLDERRAYIDEHYGKYEWFRDQETGEWRNSWLEFWYNYKGDQNEIPYRNIDNVTEVSDTGVPKIRQYGMWNGDDIWQVQNRSYAPDSKSNTAFYLAPIFSDSPMSMTVKGPKMNMEELLYGYVDNTNERHQGALVRLVNQELYRIGLVQKRAGAIREGTIKPIANFDDGCGLLFCFLPELNSYTFEDTGESFLERMVRLKNEKATVSTIERDQIAAIQDVISGKMGEYADENQSNNTKHPVSEEQYYNMVYANASIIQLTTVDLAFYGKGRRSSDNETLHQIGIDFQKRFKEVYAGGNQLNTNSKYGKKTENVIILSDDIITSPSYTEIADAINASENLSEKDKKDIIGSFQDINVADAQAIRSMHSFRSILDMMGKWDDRMEEALEHFRNNQWNREDYDIIFQTIKPFVYSVIERNDGLGSSMLVPQQNKNSEICALMMYDLISNGLNNSPVYKALSRFMEDTKGADGEPFIDMAQYESAGKVGNQGVINISFNPEKVVSAIDNGVIADGKEIELYTDETDNNDFLPNDIENAAQNYEAIKHQLDIKLANGNLSKEGYQKIMQGLRPTEDEIVSMLEQAVLITNPDGTKGINPEVVHTIPFDNYYQQQPTPEHHIDAKATFGSQARNIVVADLPDNFNLTVSTKDNKKHTFKGKDEVIDFYYELLNENLIEDFFGKGSKKGLKDIFADKESLRDAVTEIVRGNPKYGKDFAEALQIGDDGNFVLSPNSPTIFNLMQEIVTSFFKNRITKQTINGAALIQAAGIGLDEDLRLVFEDGRLVGAECYMPLTSRKLFEPLMEKKTVNGEEVYVLNPDRLKEAGLDKAVGYRIPTENKSSMLPLIIKGFTPLQNGSAIVLPAEITNIAGSDFDVDKMFVMLSEFYIQNYDMKKALRTYDALEHEDAQEMINALESANIEELDIDELPNPNFREWFELNKEDYLLDTPVVRRIEYDFSKTPKQNGRKARNNMIIQMMYGILTSKEGTESVLNPQGFKDVKRAAKITRIITDSNLRTQLQRNTSDAGPAVLPSTEGIIEEFLNAIRQKYPYKYDDTAKALRHMSDEQIQQMYIQTIASGGSNNAVNILLESSTKDLEKFINTYSAPESPVYPQTFAHSHAKNMAGMNQIGIYAIQGSMAAKYQRASVRLKEEQQFTINGNTYTDVDVSDNGKRLKNVGQMIGASADNGKDPNLSDMGSTSKTAPIIGYMLRTGLSHLEAALIINQPHMWMSGYSHNKKKYWEDILGKMPLATPVRNVDTALLIKSIMSPLELTAEEDREIAALCYRILMQSDAQEYLTKVSRADSPNGSMQNSYAKARIQRYKVDLLQAKMSQPDFPFIRISEALSNNAVDTSASEDTVREQLKSQPMGLLHGMYALGINSFQDLASPYFFGARKWFDDRIVKPILYNLNEKLPDSEKEAIVNNIYKSYITYKLSGTPLFGSEEGETMKHKREAYLESFPDDYIKAIQENEDIRNLIGSVLQVKNFGSRKRVVLQDVGSLSKGQKQDVQRRFESLMYSENPEAIKLAKKLFIYSFFDNGLQFTNDSFSHLFTTNYLLGFDTYTDTLNHLGDEISQEEEENFISQFLLTYPNAAYKVDGIVKEKDVVNDTIKIDLQNSWIRKNMVNELMSPDPRAKGINVYPYISHNGDIYILDRDMFDRFPGTPMYHRLNRYSTFPRLPLFSSQMSVTELAQEFPVGSDSSDWDTAGIPETEDPSVEASMYESFESMDDSFDFPDPSDFDGPVSQSDRYHNEGEGELQKPMCK